MPKSNTGANLDFITHKRTTHMSITNGWLYLSPSMKFNPDQINYMAIGCYLPDDINPLTATTKDVIADLLIDMPEKRWSFNTNDSRIIAIAKQEGFNVNRCKAEFLANLKAECQPDDKVDTTQH